MKFWLPCSPILTKTKNIHKKKIKQKISKMNKKIWAYGPGEATVKT